MNEAFLQHLFMANSHLQFNILTEYFFYSNISLSLQSQRQSTHYADVAKLVDALDLGSSDASLVGSSPVIRTFGQLLFEAVFFYDFLFVMFLNINGTDFDLQHLHFDQLDANVAPFLKEWLNPELFVGGHTSGSTGTPKPLQLNKQAMRASARLTNVFFNLQPGQRILLCLSTDYIAGKMIVVRALMGNLRLVSVPVQAAPVWEGKVHFAAMVPMQVQKLLETADGLARLQQIDQLIIGGSPLSEALRLRLSQLATPVAYQTYGMTETLSHVAVARIGKEKTLTFQALKGINFGTDERDCLVISAPHISAKPFVTNDVVCLLNATTFQWLGRWDNVVNSGGIKLFPEVIEKKIAPLFSCRFFLAGEPDSLLDSRLSLWVEDDQWTPEVVEQMRGKIKLLVKKYECPQIFHFCKNFELTANGKLKRNA